MSYLRSHNQSTYSYLHNLIFLQSPLIIRSSCCHPFSPTNNVLIKHYRSLIEYRYSSPRLWNQFPDSFRHPRQSCLDSPLHSLANPSLSSPPLSASITSPFIPASEPNFSTNPSHLIRLLVAPGLPSLIVVGLLELTYHAHRFIFSSFFV